MTKEMQHCYLRSNIQNDKIILHHLRGSIVVSGNSLYDTIDSMADEEFSVQAEVTKGENNASGNKNELPKKQIQTIQKENLEVGNVRIIAKELYTG